MTVGGSNLGERDENETTRQHSRVRHLKFGKIDGFVAVKEDVQVDEARAFGKSFCAAHGLLDVLESPQEFQWRERGLGFYSTIQEPGLVEIVDGFGFIKVGNGSYGNTPIRKHANGSLQVALAMAQVGTERKVDERFGHDAGQKPDA